MKYLAILMLALLGMTLMVRCDDSKSDDDSDESCMECGRALLPVCAVDGTVVRTFPNECYIDEHNRCKKTHFKLKYHGDCKPEDIHA